MNECHEASTVSFEQEAFFRLGSKASNASMYISGTESTGDCFWGCPRPRRLEKGTSSFIIISLPTLEAVRRRNRERLQIIRASISEHPWVHR